MKSIFFTFLLVIFCSINASESQKDDELQGVSHKLTKSVFCAASAKFGEYMVSGLLLNALDELGKSKGNTILESTVRSKWFSDNRSVVKECGSYIGILVGFTVADYLFSMGEHVCGSWIRCGKSLWDWDSEKSSQRDKVITCFSAGMGLVLFYHKDQVMEILWGKNWQKLVWK